MTPNKELRKKIDKIVFRCFDQGTYWGKLVNMHQVPPDKPDQPIDRTEAVNMLTNLIEAELDKERDWCAKQVQITFDDLVFHIKNLDINLTKKEQV